MTSLSVLATAKKRRRFSSAFKASIVEACRQPDTSVAAVALAHSLNANLVHKWIRKELTAKQTQDEPSFVPIPLSATPVGATARDRIRIEIPRDQGAVIIEWPLADAATCQSLLREMLR